MNSTSILKKLTGFVGSLRIAFDTRKGAGLDAASNFCLGSGGYSGEFSVGSEKKTTHGDIGVFMLKSRKRMGKLRLRLALRFTSCLRITSLERWSTRLPGIVNRLHSCLKLRVPW